MNAKELIDMAKYVLGPKGPKTTYPFTMHEACAAIADHILSTVALDDDEPITVEWVRSRYDFNEDGMQYYFTGRIIKGISLQANAKSGGWEYCELVIGEKKIGQITRGQLRQLLKVLGAK